MEKNILKKLYRMDINGKIIDQWTGVREMARKLNLDISAIKRVIIGKNNHHKHFKFKFA